jgi:DNA-3-methyladenine glycosylase I
MSGEGLRAGADGQPRCAWHGDDPLMLAYHDTEWGQPVADDYRLFEKLCLEGFQAGLSWRTILNKRAAFHSAFAGFDFDALAGWGAVEVERLLLDPGIVRHRAKIESALNNARRAQALREEAGSLAAFFWRFEPGVGERPERVDRAHLMANPITPASRALSQELKRRGWTFVGPTTLYAFMQAMGMVNDHLEGCVVREEVEQARASFARPGSSSVG